jgi:hypothetical protein
MTAAEYLADALTTLLEQQVMPLATATPRQPSTSVTPEEVELVVEFRRAFADLFEDLTAQLVALLRQQIPPIVVEAL